MAFAVGGNSSETQAGGGGDSEAPRTAGQSPCCFGVPPSQRPRMQLNQHCWQKLVVILIRAVSQLLNSVRPGKASPCQAGPVAGPVAATAALVCPAPAVGAAAQRAVGPSPCPWEAGRQLEAQEDPGSQGPACTGLCRCGGRWRLLGHLAVRTGASRTTRGDK